MISRHSATCAAISLPRSSGGNGSGSHLTGELFQIRAGVKLTHVPYRDFTQAVNDLGEDRIQMTVTSLAAAQAQTQSGKVKLLAVTNAVMGPEAAKPFAEPLSQLQMAFAELVEATKSAREGEGGEGAGAPPRPAAPAGDAADARKEKSKR